MECSVSMILQSINGRNNRIGDRYSMSSNTVVLLHAVKKYDLDENEISTIFFFKKHEMINFIKNNSDEKNFIYRGYTYDPLLPRRECDNREISIFENFDDFKKWVKPEYMFMVMDLYTEIKKGTI